VGVFGALPLVYTIDGSVHATIAFQRHPPNGTSVRASKVGRDPLYRTVHPHGHEIRRRLLKSRPIAAASGSARMPRPSPRRRPTGMRSSPDEANNNFFPVPKHIYITARKSSTRMLTPTDLCYRPRIISRSLSWHISYRFYTS
jgi:hypothetical protein